jgi:hypothetical protein
MLGELANHRDEFTRVGQRLRRHAAAAKAALKPSQHQPEPAPDRPRVENRRSRSRHKRTGPVRES